MLSFALIATAALSGVLNENFVSKGGLCDANVKQYYGYYTLNTSKPAKNYFYWGFGSRNDGPKDPVVVWLTGGPGCSSQLALFFENGPCSVNSDGTDTIPNPYSWNNNATILFVDQPTGTGFSYGGPNDHNEDEVAADGHSFLVDFFSAHSELADRDFYIYGESYAGHYVPAWGRKVFDENQKGSGLKINLKGISIGNGLTEPVIQYQYYGEMANSTNGHQPLDPATVQAIQDATPQCVDKIKKQEPDAVQYCNMNIIGSYQMSGRNPYDMRIPCGSNPLCYNMDGITTYLNSDAVRQYLKIPSSLGPWTSCNREPYTALQGDWMNNLEPKIPAMLAGGVRVEIYAGDQDFICNWLGNQAWTLAMDWPHKDEFNAASFDGVKNSTGFEWGKRRYTNGFSFVQFYQGGHMVPHDQPSNALDLFNKFVFNLY